MKKKLSIDEFKSLHVNENSQSVNQIAARVLGRGGDRDYNDVVFGLSRTNNSTASYSFYEDDVFEG